MECSHDVGHRFQLVRTHLTTAKVIAAWFALILCEPISAAPPRISGKPRPLLPASITSKTSPGEVFRYSAHRGPVLDVALSPDGRLLATGKRARVLSGHKDSVTGVTFLPGGQYLVSSSLDGTAQIWNLSGKIAHDPSSDTADNSPATRPRIKKRANEPVPDKKEYAKAATLVGEIFKSEYDKAKNRTSKGKLAKKILRQGLDPDNSAEERYALFQVAMKIAIEAGEVKLAIDATDQTIAWFAVDADKLLLATIAKLSTSVRRSKQRLKLVRVAFELTEQSIAADRPDRAEKFIKYAESVARVAGDRNLRRTTRVRRAQIRKSKRAWDSYREALKRLKIKPKDADASLTVGRYLCFSRGQWAKGLPHLDRGSDGPLKELAAKDLANPTLVGERVALAQSWQKLAATAAAEDKIFYRAAAQHWYKRALPELKGLRKLKVERELNSLGEIPKTKQR